MREVWRSKRSVPSSRRHGRIASCLRSKKSPKSLGLPVPIPNNPLVYTYCYAIADGTGVVLIDPGWDGKDQYLALTSALADLGFKVADIHGLAITHYHRDHIGLAPALLAKNPDAWIAMHGEDLRAIKRFYTNAVDLGTGIDPNLNIARAYGVPEGRWAEVESLQAGSSKGGSKSDSMDLYKQAMSQLPENIHVLDDGTELPLDEGRVTAMWTPGHAYGYSAFVRDEDKLFFSGDHVLPTITRTSASIPARSRTASATTCARWKRSAQLDEDVAVLPAHGFRFTGLHDRKVELVEHHHERLGEIRARMEATDDHSVYSIAAGLHWSRGPEPAQLQSLRRPCRNRRAHALSRYRHRRRLSSARTEPPAEGGGTMSTEFVPAAEVRPTTFAVRASDHVARGQQRGEELRTGIVSTLDAYRRYFSHLSITEAAVQSAAASSWQQLREWWPTGAEEVEAVAAGAGIDVTGLMEIIARTEIMTQAAAAPTECSTVSHTSPGASVAAQNWDWAADFSTLWHFNDVGSVPGQYRHVGIAEFGMLGKIGLNEAGVGVLLNILKTRR